MADGRMFAQLMEDEAVREPSPVPALAKPRMRHVSFHLTDDQVAAIDRHFMLLYGSENRPTRSAIVGVAIEILDRLIDRHTPAVIDESLLDAYLRRHAGAQAGAQAPEHRGAHEP